MKKRLWWLTRPFVWRWRLGKWDRDATRMALWFALLGRAPRPQRCKTFDERMAEIEADEERQSSEMWARYMRSRP